MKPFLLRLRYTLAVPILHGQRAVAVLAAFGPGPFQGDHQRLLETAAALLHSFVPLTWDGDTPGPARDDIDTKRSRVH